MTLEEIKQNIIDNKMELVWDDDWQVLVYIDFDEDSERTHVEHNLSEKEWIKLTDWYNYTFLGH